jgi:outer membrane protein assembly factor BamD
VTRRFPESEYARDARLKIDMAYDQLAGKEMDIGRYYEDKDQHLAAINRFKTVVENPNYQKTTHAAEALHRLVECYLSVGMVEEAQKAAAVLGYNYPNSDWYKRSYALMTGKGVTVVSDTEAKKKGWLTKTLGGLF